MRILVVDCQLSASGYNRGTALVEALADYGHEVSLLDGRDSDGHVVTDPAIVAHLVAERIVVEGIRGLVIGLEWLDDTEFGFEILRRLSSFGVDVQALETVVYTSYFLSLTFARERLYEELHLTGAQVVSRLTTPITDIARLFEGGVATAAPARRPRTSSFTESRQTMAVRLEHNWDQVDAELIYRLTMALRDLSQDRRLSIRDIRSGSIHLELDVSPEGARLLSRLFESGSLPEILGYRVLSVVHSDSQARSSQSNEDGHATSNFTVRLLFLAANPLDRGRLQLDEESRAISQKIRMADLRDCFQISQRFAARADDLIQAMNEDRPHIVHFSGHGNTSGDIELVGKDGRSASVTARAMKHLFGVLGRTTRLVVLNSCYSKSQARAITSSIDCAVGMSAAVTDVAAIVFAGSFYRALGFGHSVHDAFEQGRAALMLEGLSEDHVPHLLCRNGVDPKRVTIVEVAAG